MISFKTFYTEGKQVGILYHYTTFNNLIQIIDIDRLGPEGKPGARDISFTRDKNFFRHQRVGIATEARFVIDGDKLAHNYKIRPFNWFDNIDDITKERGRPHKGTYDEQEEVVPGPINFLSRYVIKIQLLKTALDREFHTMLPGNKQAYHLRRDVLTLNKEQFLDWIKKYYEVELI